MNCDIFKLLGVAGRATEPNDPEVNSPNEARPAVSEAEPVFVVGVAVVAVNVRADRGPAKVEVVDVVPTKFAAVTISLALIEPNFDVPPFGRSKEVIDCDPSKIVDTLISYNRLRRKFYISRASKPRRWRPPDGAPPPDESP